MQAWRRYKKRPPKGGLSFNQFALIGLHHAHAACLGRLSGQTIQETWAGATNKKGRPEAAFVQPACA